MPLTLLTPLLTICLRDMADGGMKSAGPLMTGRRQRRWRWPVWRSLSSAPAGNIFKPLLRAQKTGSLTASPCVAASKKRQFRSSCPVRLLWMCGRDRYTCLQIKPRTGGVPGDLREELQSALRQNPVDWCWNRAGLCGCSPCSILLCRTGHADRACSGLRSRRGWRSTGASAGDGRIGRRALTALLVVAGELVNGFVMDRYTFLPMGRRRAVGISSAWRRRG